MIPAIVAKEFLESRLIIWALRTLETIDKADNLVISEANYRKASFSVFTKNEEIYFIFLTRALFKKLNEVLITEPFSDKLISLITTQALSSNAYTSSSPYADAMTNAYFTALVRATVSQPQSTISKFALASTKADSLASPFLLQEYVGGITTLDPTFLATLSKPTKESGLPYTYTVDFVTAYFDRLKVGLANPSLTSERSISAAKAGYVADQWFSVIYSLLVRARATDDGIAIAGKGKIVLSSASLPIIDPDLLPAYVQPSMPIYSLTKYEIDRMDDRLASVKLGIIINRDKKKT